MYRPLLRVSIVLASVAFCMISAAPPRVASAASPSIAVDMNLDIPGVQTSLVRTQSSDPISVDIVIQDATSLGAFDIEIVFDASALALESWTEGAFLSSTGRHTICVPLKTQNSFRLGCATSGGSPPGASGSGDLVRLTFEDVHASATCLVLTLAQAATVEGEPSPVARQSGCLTVVADADQDGIADQVDNCPQIPNPDQKNTDRANLGAYLPGADDLGDACDPDIDGDGYANATEISLGEDPNTYCRIMRADLDGDGRVSMFDITLLAQSYGKKIPPAPARYEQGSDYTISVLDIAAMADVFTDNVSVCA